VKARYDYVPFGEELPSGLRPTGIGYGGNDAIKQKFTQKERDSESGLDYFGARYYSSAQGRFTSPDPVERLMLDQKKQALFITNPQRWDKYVYVLNNPLRNVDPDGLAEVPVWEKLSKELQEDLAKRFGGVKNAQDVWNNQFDGTKRQQVLNLRAALIDKRVWGNVTSIAFLQVNTERNTFSENRVTATVDNKNGWELAITTNKDIRSDLKGFESESPAWHHHEGRRTLLQKGDDIVTLSDFIHRPISS
jgi:RHS repeat-associated protein